MAKIYKCPCGEKIRGRTNEDVLERDLTHAAEAGHYLPDFEQMEQIRASIIRE